MHKYNNFRAKVRIVDNDVLKETENILSVMINVVKNTQNTDDSFAKSCRKYNIDSKKFYQVLKSGSFKTCLTNPKCFDEPVRTECISNCLWFYRDFLQDDEYNDLPDDPEESILYVMRNLSERNQDIVQMRYGIARPEGPATLAQIGEKYNLTRERIRQIIRKSLLKMRNGRNRRILLMGIEKYTEACSMKQSCKFQPTDEASMLEGKDAAIMNLKMMPVEDLGLSTRTLNGLKRLKVFDIYSVLTMNDNDLLKVSYVGVRSVSELKEAKKTFCRDFRQTVELAFLEKSATEDQQKDIETLMKSTSVDDMCFSVRSRNALRNAGIETLYDLMQKNDAEISAVKNIGTLSCGEIIGQLEEFCREHHISRIDYIELSEKEETK